MTHNLQNLLQKKFKFSWTMFLLIVIILEFVIFGIANPKFLRLPLLFNSFNDYVGICIISLFVTIVMISGGIDIQVASIIGLTSITIGVGWQDFSLNIWAAVGVALVLAAFCGALSGFFIAYCGVQSMVVTLGGSFLYSGLALLISTFSKTEAYLGITGFPESFRFIGRYKLFGLIPFQFIIFITLVFLAYILLHKTKYGRRVFLVGVNPLAAEYSGINSKLIIMSTYIFSALSGAIVGIILTAYLGTAKSDLGSNLTMNIITATVLGGTLSTGGKGSIIGTAFASLIIGFLRFGMPLSFGINTQYLDIPIGVLLVLVVVGRAFFAKPQSAVLISKIRAGLRLNRK